MNEETILILSKELVRVNQELNEKSKAYLKSLDTINDLKNEIELLKTLLEMNGIKY